ncbi:hypothetical protein ACFQZ4_35010 [Catellatospora coxensis]
MGAGVGQIVQWWRERSQAKVEDRRRAEDRRDQLHRERREIQREAYQDIIAQCIDFRIYLARTAKMINDASRRGGNEIGSIWSKFSDRASDKSRAIFKVATTHGSERIHSALEEIHYSNYELWGLWVSWNFPVSDWKAVGVEERERARSNCIATIEAISEGVNNIIVAARSEMNLEAEQF